MTRRRAMLIVPAVAVVLLVAGTVVAADPAPSPTPSPSPAPPTCAERYPEPGPAGIDLQAACMIRELIGHYTGNEPAGPTRISEYLAPIGAIVVAGLLVFWALGVVRRQTNRVLAPVLPSEWWLCTACHSVNGAGTERCYSCGAGWTPDAPVVPTAEHPEMVQRFGGDRKKGGDRPGRGPLDPPL